MMYTSTNYYWGEYFSLNIIEETHEDTAVKKDLKDIFQDFFKSAYIFKCMSFGTETNYYGLNLQKTYAGDDFSLLLFSPPERF